MHFCEMRDTPHLTNEYEIEIESKNKIKQRRRRRHRNNNNQNVAPASSSEQQQQLKIRSKMRQRAAAPLSGTVGSSVMRQLPRLQLQLPLLLVLLCAGLNGLTHVAALKGKLQLHLCIFPPLSPLLRKICLGNMINNFRALLMANKSFVEMQLWLALLRYLLVSFVVLPFSHCLPHLVVPRFGYFWLQPTALFCLSLFLFMRRVR